jgi:O-antigen/teichoic acid export membrane protein
MKIVQPLSTDGPAAAPTETHPHNPYSVHRLRRAVVRFLGGQALQALGYAAVLLLLVRVLPIADYGAYMLLTGLAEMTLILTSLGLITAGRRYLPQIILTVSSRRLFGYTFTMMAMQMAVLGLVTASLWHYWDRVVEVMGLSAAQAAVASPAILLFFLIPAFRFTCELLDALLEQGKSRFVSAFMMNARVAGIAGLLGLGMKIDLATVLGLDIAVATMCLFMAQGLLIRSLTMLRTPSATGAVPTREIARFIWHMAPADLLGAANSAGAMRFALANSLGIAESGLFAFLHGLQRLAGRYLLPGTLLRGVIMPMLVSRASNGGRMSILTPGASLLIKSNLLVVGAGIVVVAIGGDRIIALLSGGKFQHAGLTLLLMFLALVSSAQGLVLGMVLQVIGRTATLRATSFLAPVALFLVWRFADRGLNVAILFLVASAALSNIIVTSTLVRSGQYRVDWRGQGAIYVSAFVAIVLGLGLETVGMPDVPASGLALAAFCLLVPIFRPFNPDEYAIVEKAVGRRVATWTIGIVARRRDK